MTTEDFEKAQLRLDIEAVMELDRQRKDIIRPTPEQNDQIVRYLQEYFERRD